MTRAQPDESSVSTAPRHRTPEASMDGAAFRGRRAASMRKGDDRPERAEPAGLAQTVHQRRGRGGRPSHSGTGQADGLGRDGGHVDRRRSGAASAAGRPPLGETNLGTASVASAVSRRGANSCTTAVGAVLRVPQGRPPPPIAGVHVSTARDQVLDDPDVALRFAPGGSGVRMSII